MGDKKEVYEIEPNFENEEDYLYKNYNINYDDQEQDDENQYELNMEDYEDERYINEHHLCDGIDIDMDGSVDLW